MENTLGQFLRFLHYQMLFMIETELEVSVHGDQQLLTQLIKTMGTLIHITPYAKMNKGLASTIVQELLRLLQGSPGHKQHELDLTAQLAALNSISIALNLKDLIEEMNPLLKDSTLIAYIMSKSSEQYSAEAILVLQRIAKHYPWYLLDSYDTLDFNSYLFRLLGSSSDRKRTVAAFKVLEEWVKSYKSDSLVAAAAGGDNESDDEEVKASGEEVEVSEGKGPQLLESFRTMMSRIVREWLSDKQCEVCIAILSILNNLDASQWRQTFDAELTHSVILPFLYTSARQLPPLLKAASIKQLGYMVYYDGEVFKDLKAFRQRVYQIILEAANDTNLNVQIRNSWTLANISFIDRDQLEDEYLAQETLIISIMYATSNKEKVASNGLRALGYYLKRANFKVLKEKILVKINKSQQQLHRLQ